VRGALILHISISHCIKRVMAGLVPAIDVSKL
jgi:hypothetical protein